LFKVSVTKRELKDLRAVLDKVNPTQYSKAFLTACEHGNKDIAKLLIDEDKIKPQDHPEALSLAVGSGVLSICQILIHYGFNADRTRTETPPYT